MPNPLITESRAFEDGGIFIMARVVGNDAASITQASISSIAFQVYNMDAKHAVAPQSALTVNDVVFDSMQTGDRWTEDSTGYNFGYAVAASYLPAGKTTYRIECVFTPASGENFIVAFEVTTVDVKIS